METVLIVLVTGALCVACFFVGAKVGQKVSKGEEIKLPAPDPIKAIRKHNDKIKADAEAKRREIIFENIDNYDGTSRGQKDVP